MFISALDLLKIGIGPSSSHTMGPMFAANEFLTRILQKLSSLDDTNKQYSIRCVLKGSLAFTGRGHATDRAVLLGLHDYTPKVLAKLNVNSVVEDLWKTSSITVGEHNISFRPEFDIVFDKSETLPEHANGMIFELIEVENCIVLEETYFSIGGGFICDKAEIANIKAPLLSESASRCPYPFNNAKSMLEMAKSSNKTIAQIKRENELVFISEKDLNNGLDEIWEAMRTCVENGLSADGILPGGLKVKRRAKEIYQKLLNEEQPTINEWLSTYAMAVNEENADGHMVVTAPTNGAAGVLPAVVYYFFKHCNGTVEQIRDFLLTATAIGGIIKHNSSISGAEAGCQGEVGSASAMTAAGLCAVNGGSITQIENAAEMALEHHLGMTCDPVAGLVQVPCIERNAFGAVKAFTASSLALKGDGEHFMPLDNCISAMKDIGDEMSHRFKETSLGGLAVNITAC